MNSAVVLSSVYVYVMPASGWTNVTETAKLTASNGRQGDVLGWSVSIDGDTVVAGAPAVDAAYVFVKPGSGWVNMTQSAQLTASDGKSGDGIGSSVSVAGNTIVVGAPFSHPVGCGRRCIQNGPGAAYLFVEPPGGWKNLTEIAKLVASDRKDGDGFGSSAAIGSDSLVIGADCAHFSKPHCGPGAAYVFVEPPSGWANPNQKAKAKLTAADGIAGDGLGSSVSISGDTVVAGAPELNTGSGAAYEFIKPTNGWRTTSKFNAKLTASDALGGWLVGDSVSISGSTVVVGSPMANGIQYTTGAGYVFGP